MKEVILCAAIHYQDNIKRRLMPTNIETGLIICGHRHPYCIMILAEIYYPDFMTNKEHDKKRIEVLKASTQGFLTNLNRFVSRVEGMLIAKNANQIFNDNYSSVTLYSEHLY